MSRKYNIIYDGSYTPEKPIFHIYTTGIVNWGQFDEDGQNLINKWKDGILQNIVGKIPTNFDIRIHHYDPLNDIGLEDKTRIMSYINDNLIQYDNQFDRIISSEFNAEAFNESFVDREQPYLVFDMGHVYSFLPIVGQVKNGGTYGEEPSEPVQLHVLRTGFVGNNETAFDLARSDSFRINEAGVVRTFTDQIIDNPDYELIDTEPSDYIDNMVNLIRPRIEDAIIGMTGKKYLEIYEFSNTFIQNNRTTIVNLIINRIWNNMHPDQIKDEVIQSIMSDNIEKIINY
jgi:hypothetical protein